MLFDPVTPLINFFMVALYFRSPVRKLRSQTFLGVVFFKGATPTHDEKRCLHSTANLKSSMDIFFLEFCSTE